MNTQPEKREADQSVAHLKGKGAKPTYVRLEHVEKLLREMQVAALKRQGDDRVRIASLMLAMTELETGNPFMEFDQVVNTRTGERLKVTSAWPAPVPSVDANNACDQGEVLRDAGENLNSAVVPSVEEDPNWRDSVTTEEWDAIQARAEELNREVAGRATPATEQRCPLCGNPFCHGGYCEVPASLPEGREADLVQRVAWKLGGLQPGDSVSDAEVAHARYLIALIRSADASNNESEDCPHD